MSGRLGRVGLRIATGLTLLFLYVPLAIIVDLRLQRFAQPVVGQPDRLDREQRPRGVLVPLVRGALENRQVRESFLTSVEAALGATVVALVLGTARRVRGPSLQVLRPETISFVLVLPIALPGIVTAMALNSAMNTAADGIDIGPFHITGPSSG